MHGAMRFALKLRENAVNILLSGRQGSFCQAGGGAVKVKINGKHVNIKRSVTCDGKEAVDTLGITDVFVFIR